MSGSVLWETNGLERSRKGRAECVSIEGSQKKLLPSVKRGGRGC